MTFEEFKEIRYTKYSDIIEHLPFLEFLSRQCNHVTEFGVRDACSTTALITGCKETVISYDLNRTNAIDQLESSDLPCKWKFIQGNTIEESLAIDETDFLFIDTLHTFKQVESELQLHGHRVRRWIGFHDITTQGEKSLDMPGEEGINRAIKEYMEKNTEWKPVYRSMFNNGLLVIERDGYIN